MKQERKIAVLFVVLFIFLVIIVGIILFKVKNTVPGTYKYNDFEVQQFKDGDLIWYKVKVYINDQGPFFMNRRYDPIKLEDIKVNLDRDNILGKKVAYIHIRDLNDNLTGKTTVAALEADTLIERFFSIPVNYEDNLFDCDSVNETVAILDFYLGNKNEIYEENGCVVLEATSQEDFIRVSDRLGYYLLKIME